MLTKALTGKSNIKLSSTDSKGDKLLENLLGILSQCRLEKEYKALFETHLCYGDIVWNVLPNTKLSELQR